MLSLHVLPAQGEPFDFPMKGDSYVIGRSSRSGITIPDRFLSRNHARVFRRGSDWFVEDLGSRNGTLLNGAQVKTPMPIREGDVIKLSESVVTVREAPTSGMPQPASEAEGLSDRTVFLSASDVISRMLKDTRTLEGEDSLRHYAERLRLLNEVHQALVTPIGQDDLLELILDRVFDHLKPEQGAIYLRDSGGELYRAASRSLTDREDYLYSRSLIREVTEKNLAALVLDAQTDSRFASAQSILSAGVRSLIAAPLLAQDVSLGMIVLNSKLAVRQFSEEDVELLVSLASVAALRLRNIALAEEAAQRRRMAEELELARRIQLAILPEKLPEVPGYEVHGSNVPSRGVSGDYYEVVRLPDGKCAFIVADVSGKGIAAALLTVSLEALSVGPMQDGLPPAEVCSRLSRLLFARTPPEKYATAFLGMLEPETGEVRYTSAGHNAALLLRADGEAERLPSTGIPIGLLPGERYEESSIRLAPGDLLVLYTDGITEAANPEEEEYGIERLLEVCRAHRGAGPSRLAVHIDQDLESFVRGVPFADDRTLVMLQRR